MLYPTEMALSAEYVHQTKTMKITPLSDSLDALTQFTWFAILRIVPVFKSNLAGK